MCVCWVSEFEAGYPRFKPGSITESTVVVQLLVRVMECVCVRVRGGAGSRKVVFVATLGQRLRPALCLPEGVAHAPTTRYIVAETMPCADIVELTMHGVAVWVAAGVRTV
jgi:hypothetical protein